MLFCFVLGLAGSAVAAGAVEAEATTWLNVRSGPGGGFAVVATLAPNQVVNVTECQENGWCYVEYAAGPNGWVSSTYLAAPSTAVGSGTGGAAGSSDCKLNLTLGPTGPMLSLECGDGSVSVPLPGTPPPPSPPVGDQACFYQNPGFGGEEFCYGTGTLNSLNTTFNNRISSVRLSGGAKARLCDNTNLGGPCFNITSDAPNLGGAIDNKASSLAVYTGTWFSIAPLLPLPLLPPAPAIHSSGPLDLQQTFSANLDNGSIGGAGADIWYRADTAVLKFIAPMGGAQLAPGDLSNRGYAGCRAASYSATAIPLGWIPVGSYICVKTSEGRTSQFRLNGYIGTTMRISYTTWID
ncbi:MAG: SH3 domain-containing protein [Pseudorhodobacter sp.]|nr:SH3 domain-containing protein [Pseudorhodobacter sp.]